MFASGVFSRVWLETRSRELGRCDPGILETTVHALTLLGHLAESGLPFVFKGGTSLLIHLERPRRLSRDIDIVCGESPAAVDGILKDIGHKPPFLGCAEDDRGAQGLPKRRHFKFPYASVIGRLGSIQNVLLDVVEETREAHVIVTRPIRTSFLEPEREILVRIPTIESLLGDKLTAFAPNTVGVPLRRQDGSPADVQQVAKQLFDIGTLFEASTDFAVVAETYAKIHRLEAEYRDNRHAPQDSLEDSFKACLAITASRPAILKNYPDAFTLHDGLDRLRGHIIWPEFTQGRELRRTLAARAAVLVSRLRLGKSFDFAMERYTGSPEQIAKLKTASLAGTPYDWIDGVRAVNPEAYHYWRLALERG